MSINVGIIGCGAIGNVLAARLIGAGCHVAIYNRHGLVTRPIKVQDCGRIYDLKGSLFSLKDADIIFIAVKSYSLESCALQWLGEISINTPVIPLCNGYLEETIGKIKTIYPEHTFRSGIVLFGSRYDEASKVWIGTEGQTIWGGVEATIAEEFLASIDQFSWTNRIQQSIQEKWVINMVINTITAAYSLNKNKMILDHRSEVDMLLSESIALGKSLWIEWLHSPEALKEKVLSVAVSTGENFNSMAADLAYGRTLEIDYLCGLADERYPRLYSLCQEIRSRSLSGR